MDTLKKLAKIIVCRCFLLMKTKKQKYINNRAVKLMKIKFNSDDELLLNKTIEIPSMIIVVEAVFYGNKEQYPQVF